MPPRPSTRPAPSRTAEMTAALAVGFALNLLATAAFASAGVGATLQVAAQWTGVAGSLGGLVAALMHFSAVALSSEPAEPREVRRAVVEGLFSVVVGGITASYLALRVALFFRLVDAAMVERTGGLPPRAAADVSAVGFGIGVLAWRLAPGIIGGAKLIASPKNLRDLFRKWLGLGDGGAA